MSAKRWIITSSGERKIADVAKELEKAGFAVEQVFEEIGSIAGTGSEDLAKKLKSIQGISAVSPDESIDIGPPDAPETW
jgi:hypothetical protein